ncbi:MAG: hypothetical protein HWN79_10425 [Candidatus Lokiarchaeota archaeon]|nr:hypothetical protein [Candidatus Lokiarchaeota archaeon]
MEDIIPSLKSMLREAIDIKINALNLTISMTVKNDIEGIVADSEEIIVMLKMYGGLREEIPMEINVDNVTQIITLKFQNEEDFKKIEKILETLFDNAVDLLVQTMDGDFNCIRDIPNIDD